MGRNVGPRLAVIPVIIGFLAISAIVAMTFWLNARTQALFFNVVNVRAVRAEAVDLRSALQTAETSQRGYLYTHNEVYLAPFGVAKLQAQRQLKLLQAGLADYPNLQAASKRLGEVVDQKIVEVSETVSLQQQNRDAEALALVKTNHGKALMDEAEVYIGGIIRAADQRLIDYVIEQQKTADRLRLVSILSALVILSVAGIVAFIMTSYTRRLTSAQEEVTLLNADLEMRVEQRTDDLSRANEMLRAARDRAEALLVEVNHRVSNSLAMVASLVKIQANSVVEKAAKNALAETRDRILAIALVHRKLYTTGDVRFVLLDDYLSGLISHLQSSVKAENSEITLKYEVASVKMPVDQSISLGVILNEWVSNALKYAYPGGKGEIRIELKDIGDDKAQLTVADDGVGIDTEKQAQGTGFGTKILRAMAQGLGGEMVYELSNPGTIARITFPVKKFAQEQPDQTAEGHQKTQVAS
jgi:two-component sensor histidine kinase